MHFDIVKHNYTLDEFKNNIQTWKPYNREQLEKSMYI